MKKIKYLILIFVLMLFLSGCDSSAWTEELMNNIKNAFIETWYIWLIICIIVGFVGVMISIAKQKARIKLAKKISENLFKKKKAK